MVRLSTLAGKLEWCHSNCWKQCQVCLWVPNPGWQLRVAKKVQQAWRRAAPTLFSSVTLLQGAVPLLRQRPPMPWPWPLTPYPPTTGPFIHHTWCACCLSSDTDFPPGQGMPSQDAWISDPLKTLLCVWSKREEICSCCSLSLTRSKAEVCYFLEYKVWYWETKPYTVK